jgi:hypothetical protein
MVTDLNLEDLLGNDCSTLEKIKTMFYDLRPIDRRYIFYILISFVIGYLFRAY